ncbi:MAG TPA: MFS transporter [Lentisphaeria bacterium]|nr:MAG: hypothetical protein A2X45_03475 [Lentisphaerae bacterium GWF2_50_93]HCE46141.1 MFS transporter [Lentisphaeria bacterium]
MKFFEYLSGHHATRAFNHRNYRFFFAGQGISLMGTWIQQIAVSWLVYRLTNSALLLGVAGFATQIPVFFLTPVGGVCADRWNRRWILLITQFLSMLLAFILTLLFFKGNIIVWQVIAISFLLGCVNAFDMPARHSFVNDIVDGKEDIGNAIALNSFLFNSARLIGPAIAGIIIARSSEGVCFLINAFSFVAVLIALSAMDTGEIKIPLVRRQHPLKELFQGVKYAVGFSRIRNILIFGAMIGFVGMPYSVLMPVYAKDVLHGNSETLGFLTGAAGFGAITGAIFLARRRNADALGNIISGSCVIFGVGLILLSLSHSFPVSLGLMFFCGLGLMLQMASSNVTIQTIVHDNMRGRIISLYILAFMGSAPFGSLLSGAVAARIGLATTMMASGIICIITAGVFYTMLKKD